MILLNERGEIAELTSANIFAVHGSRVSTPPGFRRAACLESRGRFCWKSAVSSERTLRPADLESADEVFITSTTRELMPVSAGEGLKIRTGRAVMDRLQKQFTSYVESYVGQPVSPAVSS